MQVEHEKKPNDGKGNLAQRSVEEVWRGGGSPICDLPPATPNKGPARPSTVDFICESFCSDANGNRLDAKKVPILPAYSSTPQLASALFLFFLSFGLFCDDLRDVVWLQSPVMGIYLRRCTSSSMARVFFDPFPFFIFPFLHSIFISMLSDGAVESEKVIWTATEGSEEGNNRASEKEGRRDACRAGQARWK